MYSVVPSGKQPRDLAAIPDGVTMTTLENGLTIIVREDHAAPVISAQAWCMAGSIHEGERLGAGMSHVLEHMLFKGTTTRSGSRIDQEVQEAGGYMNAYTSFDRTVYHIDAPNTGTDVALDILCDIMQNATLPAGELEKEKQVILREMDMNADDPARRASRRLFETAYTRSPYRFTIIGYPDIFNEVGREDIVAYYRQKYAPNNVFFVIVGDIDPGHVLDRVRAGYANAKARGLPPIVLPEEPKQTAPRELLEEASVELGHGHIAWHIPDVRHPDAPVLDVLAALLGNGRSSRLYRRVRQELGIVHSVDAWTYSPGSTGLFGVSLTIDGDKLAAAREAIFHEVEAMQEAPISQPELGKAVKQFVAATLSTRKTMQGQAQDLGGSWLAANDLNFSQRYLAAVKQVTPADIQRVARLYLVPDNRTVYALLPEGSAPKTTRSSQVVSDNPIKKIDLPSGLRLLVKEDHRLPFVEYRAVFRGGVLAEDSAQSGVGMLSAKMLLKGTRTRSAEDIALEIESLGGSLDSYAGNNTLGVNMEVMTEDFQTGLELLQDVLLNPACPEAPLARERENQLASIRSQKDQPLHVAFQLMRRALFGDTGYGLDPLGAEETVVRFRQEDVLGCCSKLLKPRNCVLAVFGDISADAVHAAAQKAFADWTGPGPILAQGRNAPAVGAQLPRRVEEFNEKKQAVLVLGFPGATLAEPERYALELIQEACSDLGSRLFMRIREELGLAYYVGAQNFAGVVPGYFAFYAGTAPEHAKTVETELFSQVQALVQDGLQQEELERAKAKVVGQRKIARQDLGGLAMATALDELHGLGYTHFDQEDSLYQAVTLEDVQAAARKFLDAKQSVIAIVKPA